MVGVRCSNIYHRIPFLGVLMARSFTIVAVLVTLLLEAPPFQASVASPGEEETIRVIREFFERFGQREQEGMIDQLLELFTPDAIYVVPTGTYQGREQIRQRLVQLVETRRDPKYVITKILVQGNEAATEYISEFTDRRTGRSIRYQGVGLWEVQEGRIRLVKWYLDTDTIQRQLR